MNNNLIGKVAVVTGAGRGIGLGIAKELSSRGATTIIWDLKIDKELHENFDCMTIDVTSFEEINDAVLSIINKYGKIDILVNNAGINGPVTSVVDYEIESWKKVIDVDLNSVFLCCKSVIPFMIKNNGGKIINISSIAGKEGVQFISGYSAAKAGVIAFTKSIAKELAKDNIIINCIAPAMVETELFAEMSKEHIDSSKNKIPMGRLLSISEISNMTAWIAGPECSFTTGFTFDLTGGRATY